MKCRVAIAWKSAGGDAAEHRRPDGDAEFVLSPISPTEGDALCEEGDCGGAETRLDSESAPEEVRESGSGCFETRINGLCSPIDRWAERTGFVAAWLVSQMGWLAGSLLVQQQQRGVVSNVWHSTAVGCSFIRATVL